IGRARDAIHSVIFGQEDVVDLTLITILACGHGLLVGVPGLAKTKLVETLGTVLGLDARRVQFTPDLMPSDILGSEILDETADRRRSFRFVRGPVFAQLLMADEINRASPRTQSALLQAMQEHHVSVGGERHDLPKPFHVLATQNPIEQEGTYPLPEAQLDRFMFLVDVGYPTAEEEVEIVKSTTGGSQPSLEKILSPEKILALQTLVRRVPVPDHVVRYAVELVRHTRPKEPGVPDFIAKNVSWGAGPRASQYLVLAAKARAILNGRFVASVEDVKAVARPVLRHRVLPNFTAESEGTTSVKLVDQLVALVKG
ncbi:MoxR family ATPase, partial [Archangium sp.]|uniref:AAA family ATPase n=1 Tax=Archangium sp. TaxID=1872627 RepID=UPI002ED7F0D0